MGELFAYYTACDVAFIGGSLLPLGGQNLIEACAVGKPVVIGPHTFNFTEAVRNAVACGAAIQVGNVNELAQAMTDLFNNPDKRAKMSRAGIAFCETHRGATARTMEIINTLLK